MKINNNFIYYSNYCNVRKLHSCSKSVAFTSDKTSLLQKSLSALASIKKPHTSKHFNICGNYLYRKLPKDKIEVVPLENKTKTSMILPEFLYHLTSYKNAQAILSNNTIDSSNQELIKGVYLIDKENFIKKYSRTPLKTGGSTDLMSNLFIHAYNKDKNENQGEMAIIKIPTIALLNIGELKIRTQEDYFNLKNIVNSISNALGKKFRLNDLSDVNIRDGFRNTALTKALMSKAETDALFFYIDKLLISGYTLEEAQKLKLSQNKSIEYVFKGPINLAQTGFKLSFFNVFDYTTKNSETLKVSKSNCAKLLNF